MGCVVMQGMCLAHLLKEYGKLFYASVEVIGLPSCLEEETLWNGQIAFSALPEGYRVCICVNMLAVKQNETI